MRTGIVLIAASMALMACGGGTPSGSKGEADEGPDPRALNEARLAEILAAQPEEARARYDWRQPEMTLQLFEVMPGQTVVEVLPGGGWYSKILIPYLGSEGTLIGVDYEASIWPKFSFMDEADVEARLKWPEEWPTQVAEWGIENGADAEAYTLGTMPESLTDSVDRVLMVRALHNLARFEEDGAYLTTAVAETRRVLKPGGLVGVVQHRAPHDASDAWADGSRGYLKEAMVKQMFLQAGFELVRESGVLSNQADQPTEDDVVWRLPPSLATSGDDPELRASMQAIGESDRMLLVFRKPVA